MLLPRKAENVVLSGDRYQALLTVGRQNEVSRFFSDLNFMNEF